MDDLRKAELLEELVPMLAAERGLEGELPEGDLWATFRALVNTRPAWPADERFLALQDELLQGVIANAGISGLNDAAPSPANPQLSLWRGDITTFACDAIVNAANSQMLGCWVPGHHCIDNAIHTYAGVQLRIECDRIMQAQGHEEPTAQAKITPAFNLPSKRVIHTVGPIASGHPTALHCKQLAQCYESCLDLAAAEGLSSIMFCCISTGVYGFPKKQAAEIAVKTVQEWLEATGSDMQVVFNVFSVSQEEIYKSLLGI